MVRKEFLNLRVQLLNDWGKCIEERQIVLDPASQFVTFNLAVNVGTSKSILCGVSA